MRKTATLRKLGLGIIAFVCLVFVVIYSWSSIIINRTYHVPSRTIDVSDDSSAIRNGERLTRLALCGQCHGEHFTGKAFHKIDFKANIVGPNITGIISQYSDEEFERLIRHGVKKNGKAAWMFPASMYSHLKDESVADIISYLRTIKSLKTPPDLPSSSTFYPLGRLGMIIGKLKPDAATINHQSPTSFMSGDSTQVGLGKYLVQTTCSGCHGQNLKGNAVLNAPDLIVATLYKENEFKMLLRTGEGRAGRRDLGLMSTVSKNHLKYFNDDEIDAMYVFLQTLNTH